MKYLVTGYNGQLGYDIVRELKNRGVADSNIFPTDVADMDITDRDAVMEKVTSIKPDVIFHNAAWTNVDGAEDNRELCEKVNYIGAKNMADAAREVGAKIVYISTDYVFDGTKDGMYEVDDKTNPLSVYGLTKFQGEEAVRNYDKHFIVRISWVFGINGKNFIRTMLKLSETRDSLNVVCDQIGSPTYTVDLSRLLVDMVATDKYGTYHANNEGFCSWAEFAKYIFDSSNISMEVNPIPTSSYPQKATRPLNSKLSKKSLDDAGFSRLPSWEDAVLRYKQELINEDKEEAKILIKHRKDA